MKVHHIEFSCRDLQLRVQKFCKHYGFTVLGKWQDELYGRKEKIVLKKDSILFVMHEDTRAPCDYVDNIALETEYIHEICELLPKESILVEPVEMTESGGTDSIWQKGLDCPMFSVKGALFHSPIGKLKHSLIDKSNYTGIFLPNFIPVQKMAVEKTACTWHSKKEFWELEKDRFLLDHITFAVESGTSFELMDWYSNYLQMARCKVNNDEQVDGFKIETLNSKGDKLGLQLTAMQYHFCSEETMRIDACQESTKVVFAESLLGQGANQVDTFLTENYGPGVQHIGLLSSDIFQSVKNWSRNNVKFIRPPRHYFDEIDVKIKKIDKMGLRFLLEEHGVLLDIEESDGENGQSKYLLQVFTKPIFPKETFFFELIQRHGANGFGAGNISALWRAVDAYLREKNQLQE